MASEILSRDQNFVTVLAGVTDNSNQDVTMLRVDPTTKRLLVSATGLPGGGTVTSVSVASTNGFAGTVATATSTPVITISTTITGILSGNGTAISATTTTGTGSVVLATSPTLVTPSLGTPTALVGTNITGTASGLTAGTVTTNANLTGAVTSVGNATSLGSFTSANLAAALTDETGSGLNVFATSPTLVTPVLGAATATTINGVTIPSASDTTALLAATQTITNKRITKRVVTTTQSATPTINTDNTDVSSITGLAQAITSFTTNLSGTPVAGDLLMIQITDNGTARTIAWGASFASTTVTLPTTTVISTMLRVGLQWNTATSKWDCIAVA